MQKYILTVVFGLGISSVVTARTKPKPTDNVDITRDNINQHLDYGSKIVEYYDVIHDCTAKTNVLAYELRATKERWLGLPKSPEVKLFIHSDGGDYKYNTNLFDNLKRLQDDHSKFHAAIEQFVNSFAEPNSPDFEFYEESLKRLNSESKKVLQASRQIGEAESKFFGSLEHLSWALRNLKEYYKDDFKFIKSNECEEAGVKKPIEHIEWNIEDLRKTIQELYNFASSLRSKRNLLTSYAYTAIQTRLSIGYDRLIVSKASGLQDKLMQTLEFFKLDREVFEWRFGLSRRLGDSAYLQFEHPLRQRRAEREAASQFLSRTDEYPDAFGKDGIVRTLNTLIAFLDNEIESYQSKDWAGFFDRQKVLVEAYQSHVDVMRDECAPLLKAYQKRQGDVTSIEQFRSMESLFMEIVDVCKLKGAE